MKCCLPPQSEHESLSKEKTPHVFNHANVIDTNKIRHRWHFILTLLTLGLWGIVWWRLINKVKDDELPFFTGFDDAYWSYLIEREQPPAALYSMTFDSTNSSIVFEA